MTDIRHCLVALVILAGCATPPPAASPKAEAPAKVTGPHPKETELAAVTLTPDAESRLGIRLAPVSVGQGSDIHRFAADVVLPPGRVLIVNAAVSGTLRAAPAPPPPGTFVKKDQLLFQLTPLLAIPRDLKVTAETDVDQAKTRVETAKLRKARADKMLKDEVGTVRAVEDANNELDLAKSALAAAELRLNQINRAPLEGDVNIAVRAPRDGMIRQVLAAPGQAVTGGAPLVEIADVNALWIKVPVYAGEAGSVQPQASASVATLSGQPLGQAQPVPAPPSADPLSATVDFYFQLPASVNVKPGEKLAVTLPGRGSRQWLQVPWSAVVFDVTGGAWIYEKAAERRYVRRRVLLDHTANNIAFLASGPASGTQVVVDGVAELWGTEFGAGK